jgi:hypothetical protein
MSDDDIEKGKVVNYQSREDQESYDSKQKKIYLPDFFQKEFPNLSRFLKDTLFIEMKQ